ncbi:hypothetical protein OROHE_006014 [Orobanche hederae]
MSLCNRRPTRWREIGAAGGEPTPFSGQVTSDGGLWCILYFRPACRGWRVSVFDGFLGESRWRAQAVDGVWSDFGFEQSGVALVTEMECNSSEFRGDLSMSDGCMTGEVDVDQGDLSMSDVSVVNCPGREVTRKGKKYVFMGEPAEPIGCPTGVLSPSPPSSLCEGALSAIKTLYRLLKSVRLPHKHERADWRIDGWICFYEIAFEIGLRLPLIPFVLEVLAHYGCAPSQLMPNAWRLLLGLQSLGETKGISISVGTLRRTYFPKQHDSRYFFVESKYVFGPGGSGGIPTHWVGICGLRDRVPSTDPLGESSIENIHGVPWLERKTKELLRAEHKFFR